MTSVVISSVNDASVILGANKIGLLASSGSVPATTIAYHISFVMETTGFSNSDVAYNHVSAELTNSIASGAFTTFLHNEALITGAKALIYSTAEEEGLAVKMEYSAVNSSPKPSQEPTQGPGSDGGKKLPPINLAGPIIAALVIAIIAGVVYYRYFRYKGSQTRGTFILLNEFGDDPDGMDELSLMEKKAELVSLSYHGENPMRPKRRSLSSPTRSSPDSPVSSSRSSRNNSNNNSSY